MNSLQDAIIRLLKHRPFYGHLLLQCRRRELTSGQPLGVSLQSGGPLLAIHPEAFGRLDSLTQHALLEHCTKHLLHLHPIRRKGRHPLVWDAACDLAIYSDAGGLGSDTLPPARFQFADGLSAEEYYFLLSQRFDLGNHRGDGLGSTDAAEYGDDEQSTDALQLDNLPSFLPDNHELWKLADNTPLRLAEETVRQLVQDAARKAEGEVPGELRSLVDGLLAPSVIPWQKLLSQFAATAGRVGRKSSWSREHRRFQHGTPGTRKRQRLNVLVAIDVSDSTDTQPLREAFARELVQIARGRESRLTVLYAGSRVQKVESFTSCEAVVEVYHGGGFTDLRPVFEYACQMPKPPAAVIYLTDGFGEAPETMDFPTLWVLTGAGEKPVEWGVELRLTE